MVFEKFALKAVCLAATILLVAACETPVEEKADASGTGSAKQMTKAEPKAMMESKVAPGSQEDLVLNVGSQIQFAYDKSNLRTNARRTVERWADWMQQYPAVTVTIEGHCDERGTREYNLALGERRATAARDYLIAFGLNSSRLRTTSYGKERPYALGHNEESWGLNRRSVTVVN